jgi:beta-lactamase regulating signal transducer with metallopeptidase domain
MNAYLNEAARHVVTQSWQIALLTVIVATATFALRHRSSHIRYLLWLIVMAKCLVPPLHVVPLRVLPPAPSATAASSRLSQVQPIGESPTLAGAALLNVSNPHREESRPPLKERQIERHPLSASEWLGILWITGAVAYLSMNLLRALRGHHQLRNTRRPLPDDMHVDAANLLAVYGVRRLPRIWITDSVGQPFVWGLLRGDIYVPPGFLAIENPEHRRDILAHELSHVVRFDAVVNTLQVIAQALFWFHPFVWWANHRIRQEREKCCDEMVIARLRTTPKDYSTAIVETLARVKESGRPVPSLAVASPLKHIEGRIKTMLRPGKRFYAHPSLPVVMLAILAALATVPTTLVVTALALEPVALPAPLAEFPRTLNGWTGDDFDIPKTVQEYMRANLADDFLNRSYTNEATQQRAVLYVVYCSSRPGAILGHRPQVCFPANGWVHDGTIASLITSRSGRSVDCLIHRFHRVSRPSDAVTVLCFYVVNGQIGVNEQDFSDASAKRANVRREPTRYVAQVEFSSTTEDSVRSAASAMADAILDSLPDADGIPPAQEESDLFPGAAGLSSQTLAYADLLESTAGTWLLYMTPQREMQQGPDPIDVDVTGPTVSFLIWQKDYAIRVSGQIREGNLQLSGQSVYHGNAVSFTASARVTDGLMAGTYSYGGADNESGVFRAVRGEGKKTKAWVRVANVSGEYFLDFYVWDLIRDRTFLTSANVNGPHIDFLTLPTRDGEQTSIGLGDNKPTAGDTYTFTLGYSDGTSETIIGRVRETIVNSPKPLSPREGEVVDTVTPTFSWAASPNGCQGYYRIWITEATSGDVWSIYLPKETTSVVYNSDGKGDPLRPGGTYEWRLIAFDPPTRGGPDNNVWATTLFSVK